MSEIGLPFGRGQEWPRLDANDVQCRDSLGKRRPRSMGSVDRRLDRILHLRVKGRADDVAAGDRRMGDPMPHRPRPEHRYPRYFHEITKSRNHQIPKRRHRAIDLLRRRSETSIEEEPDAWRVLIDEEERVLAAGDRISRVVEREDVEYYPPRVTRESAPPPKRP